MDLLEALARLKAASWIDLTHSFEPGIPHYVAFPDEERTVLFDYSDGFLAHRYSHIGQWGTHVDPPSHFIEGGRSLDALPVTDMLLELVVLDGSARVAEDPDYAVDPELIAAHERAHGEIPTGAFVAFRSGWGDRWPDPAAMRNEDQTGTSHFPGWGVEALGMLVEERGVVGIGHEQTDTDPGQEVSAGRAPAELYILEADRWQVELLANLGRVPERGALILATWPKPRDGSGFPARCVALID
ncbi:MAG: cyclase family protein [Thermoleophilaceae bacterium]|nr:cyclase family protein [Thermoleophilaceae bacterium]